MAIELLRCDICGPSVTTKHANFQLRCSILGPVLNMKILEAFRAKKCFTVHIMFFVCICLANVTKRRLHLNVPAAWIMGSGHESSSITIGRIFLEHWAIFIATFCTSYIYISKLWGDQKSETNKQEKKTARAHLQVK